MTTVETALGPVPTTELGPTLMHEHFLPTEKRVDVLARLCAEGYAPRMVLSHDANCWSDMLSEDDKRGTRPRWHYYTHISRRHPPRAAEGRRHRGPARSDARAQPPRDLRGLRTLKYETRAVTAGASARVIILEGQ